MNHLTASLPPIPGLRLLVSGRTGWGLAALALFCYSAVACFTAFWWALQPADNYRFVTTSPLSVDVAQVVGFGVSPLDTMLGGLATASSVSTFSVEVSSDRISVEKIEPAFSKEQLIVPRRFWWEAAEAFAAFVLSVIISATARLRLSSLTTASDVNPPASESEDPS